MGLINKLKKRKKRKSPRKLHGYGGQISFQVANHQRLFEFDSGVHI